MSGEPVTAAGRALLDGYFVTTIEGEDFRLDAYPRGLELVLAIEAEAVAARDRELRAAVEAELIYRFPETMDERPVLDRTRVLALLADPEP